MYSMKIPLRLLTLSIFLGPLLRHPAASADAPPLNPGPDQQGTNVPALSVVWQAKERGAHQTEWAVVRTVPAGNGGTRSVTNKVTEIATGLNVKDGNGNYQPANPAFTLTPNGAEANNAAHRVLIRPSISDPLHIEKDGVSLTCRPVFINYYDPADGLSYLLAEVTNNAVGYLVSPQTVIFSNCFCGLKASIRYRNSKSGVQQDLLLHEQPGITPEALGFSPYTRLELWSAWGTNAPVPDQSFEYMRVERDPAVRQAMIEPDVIDTSLVFAGKLRMGQGKAFSVGGRASDPRRRRAELPVSKSWQQIEGESVLIEGVNFNRAQSLMQNLPVSTNTTILTNAATFSRSTNLLARSGNIPVGSGPALGESIASAPIRVARNAGRALPPFRPAPPNDVKIRNVLLAADARSSTPTPSRAPGFLIDFDLVDAESFTNFVFKREEYLCTGIAYFWGETVLSGGTIVKFNPWDPEDEETYPYCLVLIWNSIKCLTSMYSPAVFTAVGDNTVGSILDESGVPQYYAEALAVSNSTNELQYLRIAYATQAGLHTLGTHLKHSQVLNCGIGIMTEGHTMRLENVLMAEISDTAIYSHDCLGSGVHMTIDNCNLLTGDYNVDDPSTSFVLTNSIVSNLIDGEEGAWLTAADHTAFLDAYSPPVFQPVGNGAYYLTNSSPYRAAGTTNIPASLAADLRTMTTYPPIVFLKKTYGNTNLLLTPQAQREGIVPDLGYGSPPLDFVFGYAYFTNSTIVLSNSVVVGTYSPVDGGAGLVLDDLTTFVSDASPKAMNRIVRYSTVQEQSITNWGRFVCPSIMTGLLGHPTTAIRFRFTGFSILAQETENIYGSWGTDLAMDFRDCQFHGGLFSTYEPVVNVTNCLFEQAAVNLLDADTINPTFRSCTFDRGSLLIDQENGGTWTFFDNIFDKTTITSGGSATNDYNGYVTNYSRIGTGTHDVILGATNVGWQSSWLGSFYLPTNSAFIDKASITNSAQIGMYHYTMLTNQTKELTNHLDCGFHYVSVTNGVPIDTDGDGIPDYLEDLNGNGSVDSGETNWQDAGDWGLRVFITRPRNNSVLP